MANDGRILIYFDELVMSLTKAYGSTMDTHIYSPRDILSCMQGIRPVDTVEVAEYYAVVEKLENLLCHATGGKYSKAGYSWEDMERMVTDYIEECCREAIDEEVGHAYWIERPLDNFRKYEVKCSECGFVGIGNYDQYLEPYDFNYCPNCGADMRERKDNES